MPRFLVEVQYNGREYFGFQKNPNEKTIQSEIESALYKLFDKNIEIFGCSRTDAGVSARQFFFHFDVETKLPEDRIAFKLNRFLPKDIQCLNSKIVRDDFDARRDVKQKTYVYMLYCSKILKPLVNKYALHIENNLDIQKMNLAANLMVGKHDFTALRNINADSTTTVRTIYNIKIEEERDDIKISITGDGFLYNMVRIIVGALIKIGNGELTVDEFNNAFISGDRSKTSNAVPARYLTLDSVIY